MQLPAEREFADLVSCLSHNSGSSHPVELTKIAWLAAGAGDNDQCRVGHPSGSHTRVETQTGAKRGGE